MSEEIEEWRPVPEPRFASRYAVSSFGRVRIEAGQRCVGSMRKPFTDHNGYLKVSLWNGSSYKNFFVHWLVAATFIGLSTGKEVNHKDFSKMNNRASNLEWMTSEQNIEHAITNGKIARILTPGDVIEIRRLLGGGGISQCRIAAQFGVSQSCISFIKRGHLWNGVR